MAGATGPQQDLILAKPELYDLTVDASESYDLAADHPDLVKDLKARVASALRSSPSEIREANAAMIEGSPGNR